MTDILLLIFFAALSTYLAVKNFKGILHINFFFSLYIFISFYIRGFFVIEEGYSKIFNHIGFDNNIDTLDILLTSIYVIISQLIVYKTSDWFKVGHKIADLTISLASKSKSLPAIVVNIRNLYILLLILIPLYGFSYYKALARVIYTSTYTSSVALNEKGQIVHAAGSSGYFTIFLCLSPFIALILCLINRSSLVTLFIGGSFVLFNLSQGSYRILGISAAISFALSFIYLRPLCVSSSRKKLFAHPIHLKILLITVSTFFAISSWSKAFVRSLFWADAEISSLTRGDLNEFSGSTLLSSFHCFDSLIAITRIYPHHTDGYNLWTGLFRVLIWPIPRQLWANKPVLTEWTNIYSTGNWAPLTLGFLGDSYANLGILGIFISSLLLSLIFLKIHFWSLASLVNAYSPVPFICYLITLSYISVFLRDGGTSWGVWIIPLWIVIWMAKPLLPKFKT